jgi:hypothetical protein
MRLPRTVRLLVLALTFVVVVAAPARAADVIDQHNPLPSQPVSFPLDRPMAQTFRPGVNGRLTRVRFWLSQFAMPATIRVEVYSTYPDGTPSNELLATGEIDALAFPPLQSEYEASFATHPQLSTSQLYSIVLSPTGSSSFASWTLLATRNDAYAAGAAEEKDTQWAAITGADFAFTTFEDTLDTVAPTTTSREARATTAGGGRTSPT